MINAFLKKYSFYIIVDKKRKHWLWQRRTNKNGQGIISIKGKNILAHEFIWEEYVGPIPNDEKLFRKNECPKENCVNPAHFYLGNDQDSKKEFKKFRKHQLHEYLYSEIVEYDGYVFCGLCNKTFPGKKKKLKSKKCLNMIFTFAGFNSKELEQAILKNGGKRVHNISKKVTHLIIEDKDSRLEKNKSALKYKLIIWNIFEAKEFFGLK